MNDAPNRRGANTRKVTPEIVRQIRASTLSLRQLATMFGDDPVGLSPSTVHAIRRRRTWQWVAAEVTS